MAALQPSDSHRALAGVSRLAILDMLRRAGRPLTVQQISEQLGLHGNTVRFHLSRLSQAGMVHESQAGPSGPGRPKLVYAAVPEADDERQDGYRLLAEILAEQLAATSPAPAADADTAGREWGRHLVERPGPFESLSAKEALDRVIALLDELGFAPEHDPDSSQVRLHQCPFGAVADRRPDVACSVHLGLMRGALAEMGAPLEVATLEPSFTRRPCLAVFDVSGQSSQQRTEGPTTAGKATATGGGADSPRGLRLGPRAGTGGRATGAAAASDR